MIRVVELASTCGCSSTFGWISMALLFACCAAMAYWCGEAHGRTKESREIREEVRRADP